MIVKGIIDEDFINYYKPSMVIEFPYCSFKCDKECGESVCQNSALAQAPNIHIDYKHIIARYLGNPITEAIVFQGLEPLDSPMDIYNLVFAIREIYNCHDDIVIYTGYTKEEISKILVSPDIIQEDLLTTLKKYDNIIPSNI